VKRYTGAEARALRELEAASNHAATATSRVIRDLAATVEALEAERDDARRSLARIYAALGFDTDGNDPNRPEGWVHLYGLAEDAAREYRADAERDYAALEAERDALAGRVEMLEAALDAAMDTIKAAMGALASRAVGEHVAKEDR
jgi:hypothetical protein